MKESTCRTLACTHDRGGERRDEPCEREEEIRSNKAAFDVS